MVCLALMVSDRLAENKVPSPLEEPALLLRCPLLLLLPYQEVRDPVKMPLSSACLSWPAELL